MDKQSAMAIVNGHLEYKLLNGHNTSFANVNASKAVWWLNINPKKFKNDLHLLLVKEGNVGLIWLRVEGNSVLNPEDVFRMRKDKGCIDLEISSEPSRYMMDVKSGSTGYNFTKHIEHEWGFSDENTTSPDVIHDRD